MTFEPNEPTGEGSAAPTDYPRDGGLVTRLRVIEDQPLDTRAGAYVQVYDELRVRLEGGDVSTNRA
ncbi:MULTISPECIES: hypothetical protein [Subtercola]|uniref:Uncharacterized protein n=1 Tax=Subtercola vilae TaxID=2056433 RepID=A0A4T2BUD2_9MICO|nr:MULTISPECIES: hypothetical protein [Subtercola]MEA9984704.1 hypothetical protein [Subtercola sp. RTI3]TIH35265.1 hypothetical protein D4765_11105 [Subtercola vilae]